jgi:hypothetical protein
MIAFITFLLAVIVVQYCTISVLRQEVKLFRDLTNHHLKKTKRLEALKELQELSQEMGGYEISDSGDENI